MQVREIMSRDVIVTNPQESLAKVARVMADSDIGIVPVAEDDRLVGMISDRDIVVRGVAQHLSPDTPIAEVMSSEVKYCYEDEDIDHVAHNMGDLQVRRLPVVNRDKRLVGILALGDIALKCSSDPIADALYGISRHIGSGAHH